MKRGGGTIACIACAWALLLVMTLAAQQPPIRSSKIVASEPRNNETWWKNALVYEVYPRSFADSNGDGVGDLNGVTSHLDYLQQLGVDALWLTPIYPSPQVDFGYDISDYKAVDPQYGTLADFDRLLAQAKSRHIRIVLDMVLNHTSDQSAWFLESSSSRTNAKADWYVWQDGVPASTANLGAVQQKEVHEGLHGKVVPPNNWTTYFGDSAWTWVPARQQFYYHLFYAAQPDLNWRNPRVEETMFKIMRFWLDRGVAGFRLDAIQALFEDPQLRNTPAGAKGNEGYQTNLPEVHGVLRRLRAMTDSYPGQRVLIGELLADSVQKLDLWYGGRARNELQLPMDYLYGFPHMLTNPSGRYDTLDTAFYRKQLLEISTELHGSRPFIFFDNHDQTRSIDRFGDGIHDVAIARVVAALLLTAPATAQTYYGAEIGMATTEPTRREEVKDPVGRAQWPTNKGRDGERTPMQWTPGAQAGFSTDPKTWLPIPPSFKAVNVETESRRPDSLLKWYKSLAALRRSSPAMRDGGIAMIDNENHDVLSFVRTAPGAAHPVLVMLNMTSAPQTVALDLREAGVANHLLRTLLASPGQQLAKSLSAVQLPPFGVWIAETQ